MSAAELAAWDAVETAERVRRGDVTAREVVDAAIARAEASGHLGAIVTDTFERARAAAATASGPLAGVPTFIKDLAHVAGVRTSWGSKGAGRYTPKKSDPSVTRIERTGLVSLGKSATPELGLTATTEPLGRAPCRNPWDETRSAGGSSGGAACLVAAGVVPIAHASDGGGSIRIPASCCGVVGLKPTRARFDMEASNLLPINIATHGVVARTVRDVVAFWTALESQKQRRRRALPAIGAVAPAPAARLRVGVFADAPLGTPVDAESREAALAAGGRLEELGHRVEAIACPFDGAVTSDFMRYWGFIAFTQIKGARLLLHSRFDASKLEPWTVGMAEYFRRDQTATARAVARLMGFGRTYAKALERFDVLLCPTLAAPPPPLGHLATDAPFETAFERLETYAPFCSPLNVAGAPAVSLPMGRTADGLPIGVQLAGAPGADRLLLELASELEQAGAFAEARV